MKLEENKEKLIEINQKMVGQRVWILYEDPFEAEIIGAVDERTLKVQRGSLTLEVDIFDIRT